MMSAKFWDFLTPSPPVRKFTLPPLLRMLTMSAFEGTPLPLQCGHHIWKSPNLVTHTSNWLKTCSIGIFPSMTKVCLEKVINPRAQFFLNGSVGGSPDNIFLLCNEGVLSRTYYHCPCPRVGPIVLSAEYSAS